MKSKIKTLLLDGSSLTARQIYEFVADPQTTVRISSKSLTLVRKSYFFLQKETGKKIVYGVNTGFGPMASHILGKDQLIDLQYNLIRSHAAGIGAPIATEYVLAAMLVRLNTLVKGHSGVSAGLIQQLQLLINKRIIPVVPEHGAVGTSGDLVQLAHIALALIGEGEVYYKGQLRQTKDVLKRLAIKPYKLQIKEGLALINGTSVMSGISALLCIEAQNLLALAIGSGCLTLELVHGFDDSFSKELNDVRPHSGQVFVAAKMREILASSKMLRRRKDFYKKFKSEKDVRVISETVQEVYSIRCIPQILGPVADTIQNTLGHVEIEINSVTDNPVIFPDQNAYLHGGNFHGDYIAAMIDQLKMTLVKLTMLSERRINFLMNPAINQIFPPFMNLKKPGLTLGLQGLQFVATSTTAQSQTLAFPQYVHSIPTNADNQDLVSMGTDAALLTAKVIDNAYVVLAIELAALAQGVDFLSVHDAISSDSRSTYKCVRKVFEQVSDDRFMAPELYNLVKAIKSIKGVDPK